MKALNKLGNRIIEVIAGAPFTLRELEIRVNEAENKAARTTNVARTWRHIHKRDGITIRKLEAELNSVVEDNVTLIQQVRDLTEELTTLQLRRMPVPAPKPCKDWGKPYPVPDLTKPPKHRFDAGAAADEAEYLALPDEAAVEKFRREVPRE